jgi:hypothetical protein
VSIAHSAQLTPPNIHHYCPLEAYSVTLIGVTSSASSSLSDRYLALVFAHAPAGLGHLRVTNALRHGLPKEAEPFLLVSTDQNIRWQHRLTSVNPIGKALFEWVQNNPGPETAFTRWYRHHLRKHVKQTQEQILFVLQQRLDEPKTLLVIATHFGLAHQVAALKKVVEEKTGIKIFLIVQVTDDSPQKIWYVPGADLIFVPSQHTADTLMHYGKEEGLQPVEFVVAPYPVSPQLIEALNKKELEFRVEQLQPQQRTPIHVSVPISGAAVGLVYTEILLETLHKKSKQFLFHVVSKRSAYTQLFLTRQESLPYSQVLTSHSDRQIVELYEEAFAQTVFSIEITKPSEQAFKSLICTEERGGVILLFANPVGRQEYENLAFLRRNDLLPNIEIQQRLYELAKEDFSLKSAEGTRILAQADRWRSIILPENPLEAAHFIWWLRQQGVFSRMLNCRMHQNKSSHNRELGNDGVAIFWKHVSELLSKNEGKKKK